MSVKCTAFSVAIFSKATRILCWTRSSIYHTQKLYCPKLLGPIFCWAAFNYGAETHWRLCQPCEWWNKRWSYRMVQKKQPFGYDESQSSHTYSDQWPGKYPKAQQLLFNKAVFKCAATAPQVYWHSCEISGIFSDSQWPTAQFLGHPVVSCGIIAMVNLS